MFSFQYNFYPNLKKVDLEEFSQEFWSFVSSLNKNNQIITDRLWNIVKQDDRLHLICTTPDEDSLESRYYNKYCRQYFDRLNELSTITPNYHLLGRTLDTRDACKCVNPSFYILFTTFLHINPPVRCGDCGNLIPLYKLPKLDGEEEYNSILGWAEEYKACDTLFILSGVGERFGYRQMSQIDSNLTKEGLDICRKMTAKVGRSFYYYLHKYYQHRNEHCLGCKNKWWLDEELLGLIRYKCDQCLIVSNEPSTL